MMARDYAVYKGDELLVVGTKKECANFFGIKKMAIEKWATPGYIEKYGDTKRKVAIRLEEDE